MSSTQQKKGELELKLSTLLSVIEENALNFQNIFKRNKKIEEDIAMEQHNNQSLKCKLIYSKFKPEVLRNSVGYFNHQLSEVENATITHVSQIQRAFMQYRKTEEDLELKPSIVLVSDQIELETTNLNNKIPIADIKLLENGIDEITGDRKLLEQNVAETLAGNAGELVKLELKLKELKINEQEFETEFNRSELIQRNLSEEITKLEDNIQQIEDNLNNDI